MRQAVQKAKSENIAIIAFGDLFLENVRQYREDRLLQEKAQERPIAFQINIFAWFRATARAAPTAHTAVGAALAAARTRKYRITPKSFSEGL